MWPLARRWAVLLPPLLVVPDVAASIVEPLPCPGPFHPACGQPATAAAHLLLSRYAYAALGRLPTRK